MHLLLQDSGFRTGGVVMAEVDLGASKLTPVQATADAKLMVEALKNTPGVEAATAMSDPPISGWYSASHRFSIGAHGVVHTDMQAWPELVSPDYFAVMGTRIQQGRSFDLADEAGSRLCILGASAARYFFPGEDAIGRFVFSGGSNPALDGKRKTNMKDSCRVVGVAEDARFRSLRDAPPRMLYEPLGKDNLGTDFTLAMRGPNPAVGARALRDAVRRVTPSAVQPTISTFNQLVKQNLRTERLLMALSLCFAGVALLLTALGLYGLLSRMVALRTKEIGIRMALGAQRRSVMVLFIRQGLLLVLVGMTAGLVAAVAAGRLLRSLLFGVQSATPYMFAAAVAIILIVTVLASYVPARRATKVDPMVALRYE